MSHVLVVTFFNREFPIASGTVSHLRQVASRDWSGISAKICRTDGTPVVIIPGRMMVECGTCHWSGPETDASGSDLTPLERHMQATGHLA